MATHDVSKELEMALGCVGKGHIEPRNFALFPAQPPMVVTLGTALPAGGIVSLSVR